MGWFQSSSKSQGDPLLAEKIDHSLLQADATLQDVKNHCKEALAHRFYSVFVNPGYVSAAAKILRGSGVKVGTVVGFPLGADLTSVKVYQAKKAVKAGAREIDMVLNIGALKSGQYRAVKKEIRKVVRAVRRKALVKVILECCLLTRPEKVKACELAVAAGAHFVKTSTGFSSGGATIEDVQLLRDTVGDRCGVKAAGGIRDREFALALLQAGATRLGTSCGPTLCA